MESLRRSKINNRDSHKTPNSNNKASKIQQQLLLRQQQGMQHKQQVQQQLAAQQANSQHSNQGHQPGSPTKQQAAQAQQAGQIRVQSRIADPNEQNRAAAQGPAAASTSWRICGKSYSPVYWSKAGTGVVKA